MIIKKTTISLLIFHLLLVGCSSPEATAKLNPDEAISIALPHINKAYPGSSNDKNEYTTFFENGVWTVSPKLSEGFVGGGASAEVSDKESIVIRTLFTE